MTRQSFIALANSIIGVSVLSIPFTFQKCGILLSIIFLLLSNYMTRVCCNFLLKCSIITRRKNFEGLGFHAFGSNGKTMVELCVIGYLMGTCVAFFVVIGDLFPEIVGKLIDIHPNSSRAYSLRIWLMIFVTVTLVIPLSFQKNVDSLSFVCSASIGFYICLVLKTMSESTITFKMDENWMSNIEIWRPAGLLQCLPIFSMSLSCQMQLFEVYETFPFQSLEKMYQAVKAATSICTVLYIFIGFFGYVAFYKHELSGNILVNFSPSIASDAIKLGFVLSVACSIPLIVLPCRNCLNSFLQRRTHSDASGYLPESRYRPLTLFVVIVTMILGILIPSIEVVIGLIGSTIGVVICVIFPAATFIKITKRNTMEKFLAQIMITLGFLIMILGTYANLNAMDMSKSGSHLEQKPEMAVLMVTETPVFKVEKKVDEILKNNPKIESLRLPETVKNDVEKDTKQESINKVELIKNKLKESEANKLKLKNAASVVVPPVVAPLAPTEKVEPINKDAILKEEREIAIERQEKNEEIKKLEETKEILEKEVKEMKEELVKQNKETQKLVLQKFEEIEKKVENMAENLAEKKQLSIEELNQAAAVVPEKVNEEKDKVKTEIKEKETKENVNDVDNSVKNVVEKIDVAPQPQPENLNPDDPVNNASQLKGNETDPIIKMLKNSYDKNLIVPDKNKNEPLSYQVGENMMLKKANVSDVLKPAVNPNAEKNDVKSQLQEKQEIKEKPKEVKQEIEKPIDNEIVKTPEKPVESSNKDAVKPIVNEDENSRERHNEIRRKRSNDENVCEKEV